MKQEQEGWACMSCGGIQVSLHTGRYRARKVVAAKVELRVIIGSCIDKETVRLLHIVALAVLKEKHHGLLLLLMGFAVDHC